MRKLRITVGLLLGAFLLSSCSLIPQSKDPVAVPKNQVPFGLLGKNIPGTNTSVQFTQAPIYLIRSGKLVVARRIVIAPIQVADVINQLVLGLTEQDIASGKISAIPRGLKILQVSVLNGVTRVNLASSIAAFSLIEQPLSVGQIVLTANAAGAKNGVVFAIEGVTQDAITPSGKTVAKSFAYEFSGLLN
jgi:hypothetical protein